MEPSPSEGGFGLPSSRTKRFALIAVILVVAAVPVAVTSRPAPEKVKLAAERSEPVTAVSWNPCAWSRGLHLRSQCREDAKAATHAPQRPQTAPQAVAKAPVPRKPSSAPVGSIAARIAAAWPGDDRAVLSVARCESKLSPTATGSAGERGVLQIHPTHIDGAIAALGFTWDQMYEAEPNVKVAWALHQSSGWGPWTCKP